MTLSSPSSKADIKLQELLATTPIGGRLPGEHALAEMLGVSRGTVRRLLAGYSKQAIIEVRQGEGAFLKRTMRPLTSDNTQMATTIGIVVTSLQSPWMSKIVAAIEASPLADQVHLIVKSADLSAERERDMLAYLWRTGVRRIITFPTMENTYSEEYRKLLAAMLETQTRIVLIDHPIYGMEMPCVMTDHFCGGYLATNYLIEHGHRNIAVIGCFEDEGMSLRSRLNGFIHAHRVADIEYRKDLIIDIGAAQPDSGDSAYMAVKEHLTHHSCDFTAIFATQDSHAWGAAKALHEANIAMPDHVSIIGFDDVREEVFGVPLTTMRHPMDHLAHQAMLLISGLSDNDTGMSHTHLFEPVLIERGSVRRASISSL